MVASAPLTFAGETSVFAGTLQAPAAGPVTLQVVASDPSTVNFGLAEAELEVAAALGK